ncbi:MAG: hypothetical protein ACR2M8_04240 [Pyrinomonadaceae bacterium]
MALSNNITTRSYVAEHLRTPEEMAAYNLEACLAEADNAAAFIAKALGDPHRLNGLVRIGRTSLIVHN